MVDIEFRILGPVEAQLGDERAPIPAPRQRAVLAALLLEANRVVSVDRLALQLWGGSPPRQARNTIQSLVLRLRRILYPAGSGNPDTPLVTRRPGYQLMMRPEQLDMNRFDALVNEGRTALSRGDPAAAARKLRRALELWRGDPLADVGGVGLQQVEVPRLRERRLQAMETRIEADLQLTRHDDLIAEIPALIAKHPLRERFHGYLMLALYGTGRQVEALEVFRRLRTTLATELAVEPGPALQQLHEQILTHAPSLDSRPLRIQPPAER